ncbi:MAG: HYR domain-containing protein [Saprospiraceae bacterium]|nr:HYR domain-containing protein [Candidatus Defluviibacterium haderslevense]
MGKNQIKFQLMLCIVISCFNNNVWSQTATSVYSLRLGDLKAHFNACTDVGSQLEIGVHEWTARFKTYEYDAIQNYHGQVTQTACIYCDVIGDCDFQNENMLIKSDTSYLNNVEVVLDAWENDLNIAFDEGERCYYRSEDDDNGVTSEIKRLNYRFYSAPSNEVYTEFQFQDSVNQSSSLACVIPEFDKYLAYTWSVKTSWKYTGASNLITPGCTSQSTPFISGILPSWSVQLSADVQYYFSTCDGANFDTYLTLYGTDGFTFKATNDDACGMQSRLEFTPTESGIYYLELKPKNVAGTPSGGTLSYGISTQSSNQSCASAITLSHGSSRSYNTLCSSQDAPAQTCGGANAHHDVWYKFTTPSEGELIISNCFRNNYNSRISVYQGTCGALNLVGASCHDITCGAGSTGSEVRFNSCKNRTYYISVGGINGARGSGLIYLYFFPESVGPTIQCPEDIVVQMPEGTCAGAVATYTTPVGTDNCPGVVTQRIEGLATGAVYPLGYTTNTFKATDSDGNSSTCSFNILVYDVERPVITCHPLVTVYTSSTSCSATATYPLPTSSDNCGYSVIERLFGPSSGASFPVGQTTVYFRATDSHNNTNDCGTVIRVRDTIAPTIICPLNITSATNHNSCNALVGFSPPTMSDNCSATLSLLSGIEAGSTFPLGITTNIYKATDASGNTRTCSMTIKVEDRRRPTITCPENVITEVTSQHTCNKIVHFSNATYADNCTLYPGTITSTLPSGSDLRTGIHQVTFTATDHSGNTNTCTMNITVLDKGIPIIACPENQTLSCPGNFNFPPVNYYDHCGIANLQQIEGPSSGSLFTNAETNLTFMATDQSGNTNTCSFIIRVQNQSDFEIHCPSNVMVDLSSPLSCAENVNFSNPSVTGNCFVSPLQFSATQNSGSVFPVGTTAVQFMATDGNGTTKECAFNVTVRDPFKPVLRCPNNILVDCPGDLFFPMVDVEENCSTVIAVQTDGPPSGSYFSYGETNIVYKATDLSGNKGVCNFKVIVEDINPFGELVLNDITLGECEGTPPTPTVNTHCSGLITATTTHQFPITDQGSSVVSWNFKDGNGHEATINQNIFVQDVSSPVPVVENLTVIEAECSAAVLPPSAIDNCAGLVNGYTNNPTEFNNQGTYNISWTYKDGNGNFSHQEQTVIINDVTLPVIPVLEDVVLLACQTIPTPPKAEDNCAGLITGKTTTEFPIRIPGMHTVVWSFDDGNGNSVTATQTVQVEIPNVPGQYLNLETCTLTPCPPGTYCPGATTEPIPCPAGKYQNLEGQTICISCLAGTFSSTIGSTYCESCPAGKYQGEEGQTSCLNCPKGKYSNATGSIECASCPPGSYSDIIGSSICASCPPGTYQGQPGQDHCESCLAGTFSSTTGSTYCESCPAGKYQGEEGQTSCLNCPKGSYSSAIGSIECASCPAGKFQDQEGRTSCLNCPPGSYSDVIGSSVCANCPAGTYQGQPGQDHCESCPAGTFSSSAGSIICESCPAGTYQGQQGQDHCESCGPGTYSNATRAVACTNCPPGKYQSESGQISCANCPAGSFSAQEAAVECASCPTGTYQGQQGQDHCESCGPGTYSNVTGAVACTNCPPGKFSASSGSTNCSECPVQTYNPYSGASECLNCPAGTYNPNTGAIICPDCVLNLSCVSLDPVNTDVGSCSASSINLIEPVLSNSCPIISLQNNAPLNYPVGSTVVTWTATDVSGVTATCQQTVTVTKFGDASLLYAYTILSNDEVKMKENIVESGGVGVIIANKKVSLEKNSKIIAANTFVKSGNIDVKSGSAVTTMIDAYVPSSLKPPFIENVNPGNNDVKIGDNSAPVTLSLSNYGKIELGKNVIATLSGHANVYIKEIKLKEGSQLKFNQATHVMIDKKLDGDNNIKINDNATSGVQFYVEEEVKINKSSIVKANIYTKKEIKIENSTSTSRTYMTGQFIADKVDAGEYVTWNWDASYCPESMQSLSAKQTNSNNQVKDIDAHYSKVSIKEGELFIYPNPAQNILFVTMRTNPHSLIQIEILNSVGEQIDKSNYKSNHVDEMTLQLDMSGYSNGIYFIRATVDGNKLIKSFSVYK